MNKIATYQRILEQHPLWAKEANEPGIVDDYYNTLKQDRGQAGAAAGALSRRVLSAINPLARALPLSSLGAGIAGQSAGDAGTAFMSGTAGRFLGNIADNVGSALIPGGRAYRNQIVGRDLGVGSILGELALQDLAFSNRRIKQQRKKDASSYRKLNRVAEDPRRR